MSAPRAGWTDELAESHCISIASIPALIVISTHTSHVSHDLRCKQCMTHLSGTPGSID